MTPVPGDPAPAPRVPGSTVTHVEAGAQSTPVKERAETALGGQGGATLAALLGLF